MDSKFSSELDKIEKLLNKVDTDLNTDFTKVDFSTFFKNVDKTFEIYNICLEEICGQFYLLEFPQHSKVVRKLYHLYKHQLYNVMKFQLNLQREINERSDEEKNLRIKLELLSAKLAKTTDKKRRFKAQIEDLRTQIDGLNQALSDSIQKEMAAPPQPASDDKLLADTSAPVLPDPPGKQPSGKPPGKLPIKAEAGSGKSLKVISSADLSNEEGFDYKEVNRLLEESKEAEQTVASRELMLKLLKDLDRYRKEAHELKGIKAELEKQSLAKMPEAPPSGAKQFLVAADPPKKTVKVESGLNTSGEFTTLEEFRAMVNELDRVCGELDDARLALEKGESAWSAREQAFEGRIADLTEDLEKARESLAYVDGLAKENGQKVEGLEEQVAAQSSAAASLREENQTYARIIAQCEARIAELESVNATLKEEMGRYETDMPNYEAQMERMKTLSQENLEMARKIDRMEEASGRGTGELEENVQRLLELKNKKIEKLEAEVQKWASAHKKHSKKASESEEKLKMALQNLAEASAKNAELARNLQGLKTMMATLIKKVEGADPRTSQIVKALFAEMRSAGGDGEVGSLGSFAAGRLGKPSTNSRLASADEEGVLGVKPKPVKASSIAQTDGAKDGLVGPAGNSAANMDQRQSLGRRGGDSREDAEETGRARRSDDMEDYIQNFLAQNNTADEDLLASPRYECSCQTDYFSVIDHIIEREEEVRYNEVDLERIKEAADILADMIGFMGIQDYVNVVGQQEAEAEEGVPEQEVRKSKKREREASREREPSRAKKARPTKPSKIVIKKTANTRVIETAGEEKPDLSFPQIEQREPSTRPKAPKKNNLVRVRVERNEPEEMDTEDDYLVQKSKLIRNQNKRNETYEVVEFIRVPKQLNIARKDLPQPQDDGLNDADHSDMRRITGMPNLSFAQGTIEREKLFFRVYLNIKHRYQSRPERFLAIFKLTFNKVAPFEARLTEHYDPKAFLFNFAEFKEYFAAMINSHQVCGPDCPHFGRFYRKTGIVGEGGPGADLCANSYVQELPKLLEERM